MTRDRSQHHRPWRGNPAEQPMFDQPPPEGLDDPVAGCWCGDIECLWGFREVVRAESEHTLKQRIAGWRCKRCGRGDRR